MSTDGVTRGEPAYIDLYVAYGVADRGAVVRGRVLGGARPASGKSEDGRRKRLRATWSLFETDELPGVELDVALAVDAALLVRVARTDDEGFFRAEFAGPLRPGEYVARAALRAPGYAADPVEAPVLVHPAEPGLAVISDIDDTVLRTGVTDKLAMIKRVLFATPADLETYAGAPELHRAFAARGVPVVFVSGSPWNLEPRLRAFFALRGFPPAPMMLKDLGLGRTADPLTKQEEYKARRIGEVMAAMPARRFVLIGDSGERDPEIYARVAREAPDRVAAVYIHRVTDEPRESPRFAGTRAFDAYEEVARDLAARGLFTA